MIVIVVLFYIISFLLILITTPFVNYRSYKQGLLINHLKIPDIIHNNIGQHKIFGYIADIIPHISAILFFIVTYFYRKWDKFIFATFCFIYLNIIFLLITSVTTLPDSSSKCVFSKDFFEMLVNKGSCNNLGISGHLINSGILFFMTSWMLDHKYWGYFMFLYVVHFISISASHNHYTLDCVVSTLLLLVVVTNAEKIFDKTKKYFAV